MTREFQNRLKKGLRWPTEKPPPLTRAEWMVGTIFLLGYLLTYTTGSLGQAEASALKAEVGKQKVEAVTAALLNEEVVTNDDGMAIKAKIETYGGD